MAAKTAGTLIKEARTAAGMTQEQLAKKLDGITAADISKAERGEKNFSQAQLKQVAKALGITQASLLNAAKGKPASASSSTSGKIDGKKTEEFKLTAAEKKLVELYRKADTNTKKEAEALLRGEKKDLLSSLLNGAMGLLKDKDK